MRTILAYPLSAPSGILPLPAGAVPLHVRRRSDRTLALWCLVPDTEATARPRRYWVVHEQEPLTFVDGNYVGSAVADDGRVLHLFLQTTTRASLSRTTIPPTPA